MILEAADMVGAAWRDRWDSLALFTPRRYDTLPGVGFPGDPDGYPTRDEVVILLDVTNPGLWMAHCHIAEHHESGMMFSFNVDP